ncbi:LOW QUALITY PROTEIN: signal transduction histidine kinase [Dulcicalothrix desertica PCC 7102]|nr:LOW QUALITY PROTEIN: signal transduction histidine kinase [Dulcicalothrix desertica PCC 7102]
MNKKILIFDKFTVNIPFMNLNRWFIFFGEARTRILIWYLILLGFFVSVTLPLIRQRLFAQVQARVQGELVEEMEEFKSIVVLGLKSADDDDRERLSRRNDVINWEAPKNIKDLTRVVEIHLTDELPDDDVFYIAILNGDFYKSNPRGLPDVMDFDSPLMQRWEKLTKPSQEEEDFDDENIDSVLYIAEPIRINNEIMGVFVVAHTTAGERQEALDAIQIVVEVTIFVLLFVLLLTWLISGKILSPLRLLVKTAQEINESELTKRITVQGSGEIAQLTTTFNAMMDRLEVAFSTQRDFLNDAGHELRTPITIIRGHLELMGDDPEEQRETLAIVIDELDRISRFVDDLILLAKTERPDFLKLEVVNIATLTEELFTKAKALAVRNWQFDTSATGTMVVDRQRLTQAVMNLAQNATQHTKESDTISIGSGVSKGKVRFWVQDTGEGIATDDQKRIFERFARASNSRRRSEGAGLGLSIVRAIAQAHGGKIYLKSILGTGSTFTIVLPQDSTKEVPLDK